MILAHEFPRLVLELSLWLNELTFAHGFCYSIELTLMNDFYILMMGIKIIELNNNDQNTNASR